MFKELLIFGLVILLLFLIYIHFGKDLEKGLREAQDVVEVATPTDPCMFLENDIQTENVYDMFGRRISKNQKIDCARCGDFVYQGPDGCSPYQKDFLYTMGDPNSDGSVGVCTALSFPRECKFKSKNPPQTE